MNKQKQKINKKKFYKKLVMISTNLKAIIIIGDKKGLTLNILTEIERALKDHELIKIKLTLNDKEICKVITNKIIQQTNAELIKVIGKTILIYRKALKQKQKLSNVVRFF